MTESAKAQSSPLRASRSRSIARVGITIALIAVCAWVKVPIGPVPFTLQIFALTFAVCALPYKEALAAIYGYVILGAIGVPVFSGFTGGFGVIMGVTGGYIIGYLVGAPFAVALIYATRASLKDDERRAGDNQTKFTRALYAVVRVGYKIFAGIVFVIVAYVVGTVWYSNVMNVGWEAAFAVCIAPFIGVDVVKIVAAAICANAVDRALKIN
jgi:biotin transport system substrate-specific component